MGDKSDTITRSACCCVNGGVGFYIRYALIGVWIFGFAPSFLPAGSRQITRHILDSKVHCAYNLYTVDL